MAFLSPVGKLIEEAVEDSGEECGSQSETAS